MTTAQTPQEKAAEVHRMVRRIVNLKQSIKAAEEAVSSMRTSEPSSPGDGCTLVEWLDYQEQLRSYCDGVAIKEEAINPMRNELARLEAEITRRLPARRWFRDGEIVFGLAESNYGGRNYYLRVRKWNGNSALPSLDERSTLD